MEERGQIEVLSLLGGPLHRLGCRLGLVRRGTNTVALGLALGALLWVVAIGLAFVGGEVHGVYSISMVGMHVRLLVVIPLFFLCESWLDPQMTAFVDMIVRSGVVSRNALPSLKSSIAGTVRRRDSGLAEAICLFAAVVSPLIVPWLHLPGRTAIYDPSHAADGLAMTELWYSVVCLTIFRFLVFRWVWRLTLWTHFLWRVARLELRLVPTHPDGVAGLGYLEVVHSHFTPLVAAISSIQAAGLAQELSSGTIVFEAIYLPLAVVPVVDAALFLGPLFLFAPKLWACRVKGLSDYMEFASRYVTGFDSKWFSGGDAPGEPMLGTSDLQSLADLSNSVGIVRNMRTVPVSLRLLADLAIAASLPVLPLFLFKYPAAELIQKLFARLVGL